MLGGFDFIKYVFTNNRDKYQATIIPHGAGNVIALM